MAVIFQEGDISEHFSFTIWTILAVKSYIFYHREARFISMDSPGSYCLPYFHHWKDQNLLLIPNHETITCYQSTSLPLECSTSLLGNSKLLCLSEMLLQHSTPISVFTMTGYQCFRWDRNVGKGGWVLMYMKDGIKCEHVFQGSNCIGVYRTESCLVSANVFYHYRLLWLPMTPFTNNLQVSWKNVITTKKLFSWGILILTGRIRLRGKI